MDWLAALGVPASARRAPADELREVLRERALLLILDNCEHLPAVGPLVAELLAAAPGVRVLATSRERLGVYGEELLVLGGLPVPDERAAEVLHAAAVQLFVARAQRQVRSFGGDAATLMGVARLCRLLEGMPLGIELAAHWVGDYSPDEIAAAIRSDLAFLETRDRQTPDRHRSLRAVFDYSWRRLPELEQHTLARLSVFAGGFDRAAPSRYASVRVSLCPLLLTNRRESDNIFVYTNMISRRYVYGSDCSLLIPKCSSDH
jgi:predicted ATPase